jgi:tRNA A-37 threonylcarbamoyl transferase component Bud32
MPQTTHEKATAIIAKVIDLTTDEALKRIERECQDDDELKQLVINLYKGINEPQNSKEENTSRSTKSTLKRIRKSDKYTTLIFKKWPEKIFENKRARFVFFSISLIVLLVLGVSIRFQVRQLLINDTAQHLEDQLYSQYLRMQEWINAGVAQIETQGADPVVIQIAKECDSLALLDPSLKMLKSQKVVADFKNRYKLSQSYTPVGSGIVSKDGARVLANLYRRSQGRKIDSLVGVRFGKGIYNAYLDAMDHTVFVKPLSADETIYKSPDTTNAGVICLFLSPVRDTSGELIAILYNAYLARLEFSNILSRIHFGRQGETYAFDKRGRMLSSGRFVEELRENPYFSLAPDDETIYNIILKDPGGDVLDGYQPKAAKAAQPFIEPLQELYVELDKGIADSVLVGYNDSPYRNYYGKKVMSRWMWWRAYDFGIITEVTLQEALSTIKFFDYAFIILYVIILLLSYLLFKSNVKVFRFGKKFQDFKQLGQYKLKTKIGEGGFGEVYKAEHAFLKTPVAVKLLKKQFNGTDMLERFEKEVKATSSLSHPNTIRVFDYGTSDDGQFYYVMEYLNGISLDTLVQREKEFDIARGIYILLNACLSLKEAHENGLIHRDIKPGNIMLCNQGGAYDVVKVLDFGLVKSIDATKTEQTQINRIGGTPMFMAPERLRDPFNADQRVDIYSIGALGIYLFSGKYILELVSQKMLSGDVTIQGNFKSQLIERDDVPAELKSLLMQCLSFEADKRPATIQQVIEALEQLSERNIWKRHDAEAWWKAYDVYA